MGPTQAAYDSKLDQVKAYEPFLRNLLTTIEVNLSNCPKSNYDSNISIRSHYEAQYHKVQGLYDIVSQKERSVSYATLEKCESIIISLQKRLRLGNDENELNLFEASTPSAPLSPPPEDTMKQHRNVGNDNNGLNLFESSTHSAPASPPPEDTMEQHRKSVPIIIPTERRDSTPSTYRDYNHVSNPNIISAKLAYIRQQEAQQRANLMKKFDARGRGSSLSTALSKAPLSNDDLKDLLNETGAKDREVLIKPQAASAEAFDRVRQKFNQIVNTSHSSLSNQSRLAYKYNPHPKKITTDTSPPQMVRQIVNPRMDPRLRKPTYPNLNDPRVRNDHRQHQQVQSQPQPQPVPHPMSTYNVPSSGGNHHQMMMNMGLQNYHQMNMNPIGMAHHLNEPSMRDDMLHNQHHHLQHNIHQQQQQQQQHQRMSVEPPMTPGIQSPSYGGINMFNFQMGSPMNVSRTEFQSPGIDPVLQFERQKYLDSRKRKSQDTGPRTYGEYKEAKRRAELEKLQMRSSSSEVESTKSSLWQTSSSVYKVRKSSSSQKQRDENRIVSGDESNNAWDTETSSAKTNRKENDKISTKNSSESNDDNWDADDSGKMSVIEVPASHEESSKNCDTTISVSSEENWDAEENETEKIPNDVEECSKDEQEIDESGPVENERDKSSSDVASSQETEDNSSLKRSKRTTRKSSNLRKTRERNKSSSDGGSPPETENNFGLRRSKRTIRKPLHLAESDTDDQNPKKRKRQSTLRSDQQNSEAQHSQTDLPAVAADADPVSEDAEVKNCLPSTSVNRQMHVLEPTILKESNVIKETKSTEEDTESKEREKEMKPDVEETKTKATTRKSRKSKGTTQEKENSKTESSEVRNKVTRSKKKSELDRLQDDTREMFILQGGISHTGRRQCTLTKDEERGKEKSKPDSISDVQNKASDEIEEANDEVKELDVEGIESHETTAHDHQNGDVNDNSIANDDVDTSVTVDHIEEPKKPVQHAVKTPKKPSAPAQARRRKRAIKKGGKKSSPKIIVDEPNNVIMLRHEEDKIIFHEEEAVFDESNVDDMKDPLGISEDQNSLDSSVQVILTDDVPKVINIDFIEDTTKKEKKNSVVLQEDNQETRVVDRVLKNEIESDIEQEQDESLSVDPPTLDSNAMWISYDPITYKNIDPNMHTQVPQVCIFCTYHGRYLANHYAQNHPDQEVIISRLPSSVIDQLKNGVGINVEQTIISSQGLKLLHKCVFCDITQAWTRIYWIEHYGTHTGEYTFTCSGCRKHSNMRAKLQKHVHECPVKADIIRNRKLINSAKTIEAYVCNLCNFIQMSDKNIKDHLTRQHDVMEDSTTKVILLNNTKFVEPKIMKLKPCKSKRGRKKSQDYVIDVDAIDQTRNGSLNQEQMEAFIQPHDNELDLDQNMLKLMNEVSFSRAPPADYCNSVQEPKSEVNRKTSFIERLCAKVDDRKKQLQIEKEVDVIAPVPVPAEAAKPPPKPSSPPPTAEHSDVIAIISDDNETKTPQKPPARISIIDRLFTRFNKVVVPQKVDQPKRRISIVERFSTKFKDEYKCDNKDVQVAPVPSQSQSQSVAQSHDTVTEVFEIVSDTDETSQSTGQLIPPSTSKETTETPQTVQNDNQNDEDNDEEWETIEVLPVVESCNQDPLSNVVNRLLTKLSKSSKKDKRFKFRKNSSEVGLKSRGEKTRDVRRRKTIEDVDVQTKVKVEEPVEEPKEDLVISTTINSQEYPEEASGEVQYIRTSVIKYINASGIAIDQQPVSIKMEVSDPITFCDDLDHKEDLDITEIPEETNALNNTDSRVLDNDRIDDKPINDQADQLKKPLIIRKLVGDILSTSATLTIDDLKTKETMDFESNSDASKDSDSDDQKLVIVTSSSELTDSSPKKLNKNDNNQCSLHPTICFRAKKTVGNIQALLKRKSLYCFFKCMADFCSYSTNIKSEMSQHLVTHKFNNQKTSKHGQNFRPYQIVLDCSYCNRAFGVSEILQHITDVHKNQVFQCPYCFYRSVSDYNVIIHIRLHHPSQNEEILVCTCHMKTIDYEDTTLLKTLTQHHVRDIDCFECNETFHSIQCFADHLGTGPHNNSDSYKCSICNETINKDFVINHLLNSHKIGLYECINCSYASNDFDSTKPHIAEKHPDMYPVICVRIPNVLSLQRMDNSPQIKSTQTPLLLHVKEPIDRELYKHCPHHNFIHSIPQKPKWSEAEQPLPMDLTTFLDIKNEIEHYLIKYQTKYEAKPKIPIKIDIEQYEVVEELICKYVSSTGLSYEELGICPILGCVESFENDEELLAHMQRHTRKKDKKNVISCVLCHAFVTPDFKEYINHIKTHSRHRFFCYYCMTTRVSTFEMLDHMKEVHNDEDLKVWPIIPNRRNDDKDFFIIAPMRTSPTLYLQHILYKLEKIGQQWKLYYTPDELNNVPLPGVYSIAKFCLLCKYKTKVRTNLIRHLSHHKKEMNVGKVDPVNPVPCIYSTEKHFDKMTNLACSSIQSKQAKVEIETQMIHTLPKFIDKELLYKCGAEGCKYINYSYDMLRYHMNALHCEVENFCCPHCQIQLCKKKFSGDKVVKHLHLHDSIIYKCSSCAKYHYSKNVIERHILEEHNSDLTYMIEYNRSATSTTHTVRHVKPNNGRLFDTKSVWICSICHMIDKTRNQIQKHMDTAHQISHQFKCNHCNAIVQNIAEHTLSKHKNMEINYKSYYNRIIQSKQIQSTTDYGDNLNQNTTPLWRRDPNKIKNIRGILMDEETTPVKSKAKSKSCTPVQIINNTELSHSMIKPIKILQTVQKPKKPGPKTNLIYSNKSRFCHECKCHCGSTESLINHLVSTHKYIIDKFTEFYTLYRFKCLDCDTISFKTYEEFNKHHNINHNKIDINNEANETFTIVKVYSCKLCKYVGTFDEITTHYNIRHKRKSIVYSDAANYTKCGFCDYQYHSITDVESFERHFLQMHPKPETIPITIPYKLIEMYSGNSNSFECVCTLCNTILTSEFHVYNHDKLMHPNDTMNFSIETSNTYICPHCGQAFILMEKLLEHVSLHLITFKCDECLFETNNSPDIYSHWDIHPFSLYRDQEIKLHEHINEFLQIKILFKSGLSILLANLNETDREQFTRLNNCIAAIEERAKLNTNRIHIDDISILNKTQYPLDIEAAMSNCIVVPEPVVPECDAETIDHQQQESPNSDGINVHLPDDTVVLYSDFQQIHDTNPVVTLDKMNV